MKLLVNDGRGFRVDLEGIRGLALLIVLSTHLIEWPSGGHVALDLFFVLSGYLITGLIIREHERTGTIDIARFYRRRVRRLGPAATLVIVVTIVAGFLIFPVARAVSIAWDGVWAFLLVSNWNFALNGTDYFATWQPQSPLLHYWSLSVEEQFYLVWPALILGAVALGGVSAGRRRRRRRGAPSYTAVVVVIAVVSALSFAWGVIQPLTDPQVSYLSTLTRAWELGFGALLFFANDWWKRIPNALRPVLSWGGVAVLIGAALLLTPDDPYPSYWALLPAVATTGIIVSGVGGDSRLYLATNPVARYLGQVSYSVYLWHWPIFVYLAALVGKQSPVYLAGALPLAIVVGAVAFHLFEDPIRRSAWLEPRRHHRRTEMQRRRAVFALRAGAVAALVGALALVAVVVQLPRGAAEPPAARPSPSVEASPGADEPGTAVATIEKQVLAALDTSEWPAPVIAQIESGAVSGDVVFSTRCLDIVPEIEEECVLGDASLPRTAVVLGDSVAVSWMPGLAGALNDLGYRVRVLTHSQCPFADVSVSGAFEPGARRAGYPEECNDHRAWARERTLALRPDLVVAADGEAEMQTLILPEGADAVGYWSDGLAAAADALEGIPLVVLTSPPASVSMAECYTRVAAVDACTDRISSQWRDQVAATDEARAQAAQAFEIVDVRPWYCSPDGWCPAFVDDIVVRSDRQHIAEQYALRLRPVLRESLEQAVAALSASGVSDGGS